MSIKTELNKTAEYLRRTRKAILGRGGEIAETAGLKDLPDAIINIPADTSLAFQTDEETAYEKVVPSGAEEYALLKSVGGMSYKCNNIIRPPYASVSNTNNGITFTVNDDGTITANGTATGTATFSICKNTYLEVGKSYGNAFFSCCPSGGSAETYYVYALTTGHKDIGNGIFFGDFKGEYLKLTIHILSGTKVENLVFKPMLNFGSTALPYEPYFEGLRHTKVTAFESEGANLVKMVNGTHVLNNYYTAHLNNGHMRIDRKSYTSALSLSSNLLRKYTEVFLPAGTYSLVFYNVIVEKITTTGLYLVKSNGEQIINGKGIAEGVNNIFTLDSDDTVSWGIYMYESNANTEEGYFEADVMLNASENALPYKPYVGKIDTYTIPEAVQSLEGYGEGNPDNSTEHNYIDFGNRKYIALGHIIDGAWQSYETPIETDITEYLTKDNFIKVEGGGVIRAVNEHKQDAPSTIKYTVKVGS